MSRIKLSDNQIIEYLNACRKAAGKGGTKNSKYVEGFMDGLMAGSEDVAKKLRLILGETTSADRTLAMGDEEFKRKVKFYLFSLGN